MSRRLMFGALALLVGAEGLFVVLISLSSWLTVFSSKERAFEGMTLGTALTELSLYVLVTAALLTGAIGLWWVGGGKRGRTGLWLAAAGNTTIAGVLVWDRFTNPLAGNGELLVALLFVAAALFPFFVEGVATRESQAAPSGE